MLNIKAEINTYAVNERTDQGATRWKDRIARIGDNRVVKHIINYRPRGRRDVGRP